MRAFQKWGWLGRLSRPLAGAAAAAFGLWAVPAAPAQSPPAKAAVEVWYGVERVSGGKEAAPPRREPAPSPTAAGGGIPAPGVYVLPAAGYPFTPNAPPPALLPGASPFLPGAGHSSSPKPSAVVPTAHWSEDRVGGRLDSAGHGERTASQTEAPRRPAPRPEVKAEKPVAPAPAPAAPGGGEPAHPAAEGKGEAPASFLYHVVLVQLLSVIGSLVVGPLVLLLALLFVLRRFKGTGSLLRVEVVNSGTPAPTIVYGGPAAWPAPVPAAGGDGAQVRLPAGFEALTAEAPAAAKEPEVESTAQPFELGPTYEEERLQREEAERQREKAVLQHVYEENVRLREHLGQLEGADAGAAGDVGEAVPA